MPKPKDGLPAGFELSKIVEILNVRLTSTEARVQTGDVPENVSVSIAKRSSARYSPDKSLIIVAAEFKVEVFPDAEREKPFVCIEVGFELDYQIPKEVHPSDESLASFSRFNGIYNAWPYFREYVQNVIARMGLPNLTIPVFRIRAKSEEKEKKALNRGKKKASRS